MSKTEGLEAEVRLGNSAAMPSIMDGEVDLVITSPPYFPNSLEAHLKKPLRQQTDYALAVTEITEFALGLRPNFAEMHRILKPGRFLVVQTKHIRYGPYLVPLTDLHCDMALNSGFRLVSKFDWLPVAPRPQRLPSFTRSRGRWQFRAMDTETFLIFVKDTKPSGGEAITDLDCPTEELVSPLWRTSAATGRFHPHESPPLVIERLIKFYSRKGELVVDPFCGSGSVLLAASRLGRQALGIDIDYECVERAKLRLS